MTDQSNPVSVQEEQATSKKKAPLSLEITPNGEYFFHGGAGSPSITKKKNAMLAPYHKCVWNYGVVLELLPEDHVPALNQQIGNARFVRNAYLARRIEYYAETKQTLTPSKYKKEMLPALKQEHDFLKNSEKSALENALNDVDCAYQRFFKQKTGFPKYASKNKPNGNRYTSNYSNNNLTLEMIGGKPYIKLPKVGLVRFILPKGKTLSDIRPYGTKIKKATVSRSGDRWTVSIQMETIIDKPQFPTTVRREDILSVDLGIREFGYFGNMDESIPVHNPRWIKLHEKRLRRFQKAMSRKQYNTKTHTGSKNWEKAKLKVAKEQRKTSNQRRDFQHKLSRAIVESCDAFICEDLAVKNMMKNSKLAKAIASAGWSGFLTKLQYKMERAGKYFLKVDRWFASSQTCHCCGYQNTNVKNLSIRTWTCPKCHTKHDRDENAQKNICLEGIRMLETMGVHVA